AAADTVFVSFRAYASSGTIVDIAGARLAVTESPDKDSLQIAYEAPTAAGPSWTFLGYHLITEQYNGKRLSQLPVITVRVDPKSNSWDLFFGRQLLANNLSLTGRIDSRTIAIKTGSEGAKVFGFVSADESPLFQDDNGN